ncbi:MAG: DNA mismatch repair endonuclease MutL [Nanoarchaeota archaeon]
MPIITALPEDLINKIAAGEVIERPASVVKELVENALDAKAGRIVIEIRGYGQELITVADNGSGMSEEDAKLCFLRHTTSKIKAAEDLFSITTLGFRGEALASIAAVSQLSLTTKTNEKLEGYQLLLEGGKMVQAGYRAAEPGTVVEVKNLFFNTPARKKFLKSDAVELHHIVETVSQYALANPRVAFRLLHDEKELLNSPAMNDQRSTIASVYGIALAKELLEVNFKNEFLSMNGFIAPPYHVRNDKSQQALFVNGRWVRNEEIREAVYAAYHSLLFVNKHPVLVLLMEINPRKIDVNVHPTKSLIKFEQKEIVCQAVQQAVKETLQKNNLIPEVKVKQETLVGQETVVKYPFELSTQLVFAMSETGFSAEPLTSFRDEQLVTSSLLREEKNNDAQVEKVETTITFPGEEFSKEESAALATAKIPLLRLLGQIHKTFFIAETEAGVVFIDQHAAHERVLYERFMRQLLNKKNAVQTLLQPDIIEFTAAEMIMLHQFKGVLEQLGFTLEPFGSNTLKITTIPSVLGRIQPKEIIYDIMAGLKEAKVKLSEFQETIITRMACRAAVMAGEELTIPQMEAILQQLAETELPYTCPHGRPTIIKTTADELERKFRRK